MATLQPAKYGKVVGRLLAVVADGPDEDEYPISGGFPDAVPVQGTVTFTPRATQILVPLATPAPVTAFPTPITVQLDQNGFLTHNGKKGVFLLCPSETTNPPTFTYSVSYNLTLDGAVVSSTKFDLEMVEYVPGPNPADPDAGSTAVDLTLVTPVYPTPGTPVVRGPKGDSWLDVRLSNDGLALVFQLQTETAIVDDVVTIPALADLNAAVGASEAARDAAGGFADVASGHASDAEDFKDAAGGSAGAAELSASAAHDSELAALGHEEQAEHWAEVASEAVSSGVPDATASAKGKLKLSGDLGGTADSPTVATSGGKAIVVTDDTRLTNARTPVGTTRAAWNAGTADAANLGLTPAELKEAVVTHIGATAPKAHMHVATDISDSTTVGRNVLKAADAAAARTAIGAGTSSLATGTTGSTAAAGNDPRLADTRTPTAGTSPYDITYAAQGATRAVGYGDVPAGISLRRAVTFSEMFVHCETADASGTLGVQLHKNKTFVAGVSLTPAQQVAGLAGTGPWSFAAGDVLSIYVASVGTTPGKGLIVELKGLA
ncbi:hypothetical protein [Rhodococcus sp. 3-2]|uniref:hypothetical protein n=1 Tax=Rhodococcus sp. 3-2 TaxID=2890836 RepID=UPI001D18CA99|nr:hypothetical protein [Rhodococcus sp. 3-2]MCC4300430.1 hypothetical protein [Rhodococcus sp. 3-2]MCC4306058.1 hypothetical protein [Rhodococcus sp. 3-2]